MHTEVVCGNSDSFYALLADAVANKSLVRAQNIGHYDMLGKFGKKISEYFSFCSAIDRFEFAFADAPSFATYGDLAQSELLSSGHEGLWDFKRLG